MGASVRRHPESVIMEASAVVARYIPTHPDGSVLGAYVDDVILAATPALEAGHWKPLFNAIEFKEDPADISQFVGAHCKLDRYCPKNPLADRTCTIAMCDDTKYMCDRFTADAGIAFTRVVDTPYVTNNVWNDPTEEPGKFAAIAPSHAATSLFL